MAGHVEPAERFLGLLCRRHYRRLGDVLGQVEELFALLPDVLEPAAGGLRESAIRHGASSGMSAVSSGSRVDAGAARRTAAGSKRADPPAPGRLEAIAVTDRRDPDNPAGVLEAWLGAVDAERRVLYRWTVGPDGRAEHERDALVRGRLPLTTVTKWLHAERRWIAGQEWVADYATALEVVHRALAAAVGVSMWPRPIGVCPNCQTRLYPQPTGGVDEVTCHRCKTAWRGVHLARLRLIHEQEQSA